MKTLFAAAGVASLLATGALAQPAPMAPKPPGNLAKIDANGDGKVTWDEFSKRAMERFDRLDANHDGKVTRKEMMAAMHRPPPPPGAPGAEGAPPPQGAAPDGGPDHRGHMGRHGMRMKMRGMMMGMAFNRMDVNGDGVVTRDEAMHAAKKLFTFLDINDDGVLSGRELPQRHGRGGPGMGGHGMGKGGHHGKPGAPGAPTTPPAPPAT